MLNDLPYLQVIPTLDMIERDHYADMQENRGNYHGIRYELFRSVFTGQAIVQHFGDGQQKKNSDGLMRVHTIIRQIDKLPLGKIKIFVLDGTADQSPVYCDSTIYEIVNYEKPLIPGTLVILNEFSSKYRICNEESGKNGRRLAAELSHVIHKDGIKYNPDNTMLSTYKKLQTNFADTNITSYVVATHGNITGTNIYRECETLFKVGGLLMPMFSALLASLGRHPEAWNKLISMSEEQQILELGHIMTYTANADNSVFYDAAIETVLQDAVVRTVQEISRLRMRGWPCESMPADKISYRVIWIARCRKNYNSHKATLTEELVHRVSELLGMHTVWHNSVLDPWQPPAAECALEWIRSQAKGKEYTRSDLAQALGISTHTLNVAISRNQELQNVLQQQDISEGRTKRYRVQCRENQNENKK